MLFDAGLMEASQGSLMTPETKENSVANYLDAPKPQKA